MAAAGFAVLGEALVDLGTTPDGRCGQPRPGGSPFNVAVGLARLGRPTAFLGRFSSDAYGGLLRAHAAGSGVDLSYALATSQPSTVATVRLGADGVAGYEFAVTGTADFGWTDTELCVPRSARVVHFGSLASWLPPGAQVIERRMSALRAAAEALISYDPNVRPQLQHDRAAARANVERSLRHAHVVKASEEDLRWLYPDTDPLAAARRWLGIGPTLVVLTRGSHGSLALTATRSLPRPARSSAVLDTVGAGDAFTSGLLDAFASHGAATPERLVGLGAQALADCLDHAALVAAITCARAGADPPYAADLPTRATAPKQ